MKKIIFCMLLCVSGILFGSSLNDIKANKVIKVGVDVDSPPFSATKDGQLEGFEIEFAKQIAKRIFENGEGSVEFINVNNEDQAIEFLKNNKIDIAVSSLETNEHASKLIDFSMPYFSINVAALSKTNSKISKVSDLLGKNILVMHDTDAEDYAKKQGYNIVYCNSNADCYRALKTGKGDIFMGQNIEILAFAVIDRNVEVNLKSLSVSDFLAIGVQKGNKDLTNKLNDILISLSKEGFFKDTFEKTFDPFYKGHAEQKYFLLEDIYKIFG